MSGGAHSFPSQAEHWQLVDHACRHCLGRIVRMGDRFRCSGCGRWCLGGPQGVCGCGIKVEYLPRGDEKPREVGKRARWHCARNPAITLANPAEIVIWFGDVVASPEGVK